MARARTTAAKPRATRSTAKPPPAVPPDEPAVDEVIDVDAVEITDDDRPTLAEYEAAKEIIKVLLSTSPPTADQACEALDAEEAAAYEVIQRAEKLGIRASQSEEDAAGVTVAMLPAIRESLATQEVERKSGLPPTTVLPSPKEWEAAMTMATEISRTKFVPDALRNKPDEILACILTGREIGIGPMEALRKIHMIDGRPAFAADLMLSQMRKGGMRIVASESTAERAWIKAKRSDTGEEAEVEWTYAEASLIASKGGSRLVDKDNWKNYPADMLWARCVGRLARRLGSDLLGGMNYTAEEVGDFDDYEGSYATGGGKVGAEPRGWAVDTDLLPGSIPLDAEYWHRVGQHVQSIDNQVNWGDVFTQAAKAVWPDIDSWRDLSEDDSKRFARRLSNSLTKVVELSKGGDLVSDEHIAAGFAFGFNDVAIDLVRGARADDDPAPLSGEAMDAAAAEAAANDDIPFGEPDADEPAAAAD